MTEYKYHLASQKRSNSINKCKFCEVPKKKASQTSSEAHKAMPNLPSPLMTEANYNQKYQCSAKYIKYSEKNSQRYLIFRKSPEYEDK